MSAPQDDAAYNDGYQDHVDGCALWRQPPGWSDARWHSYLEGYNDAVREEDRW